MGRSTDGFIRSDVSEKICLVSNVVGNKDVIKSGYNGYLCNNAMNFINIIKKFFNIIILKNIMK